MAKADLERSTEQIHQINESLIDLNQMNNDYQDIMSERRKFYEEKVNEMKDNFGIASEEEYDELKNQLMVLFHQYKENFNEQRDRYNYTRAQKYVHKSVIAYFINTLYSQIPGRDRVRPNYLKVGDLFYKICTSLYANFRKKGVKLCFDFYVMSVSHILFKRSPTFK